MSFDKVVKIVFCISIETFWGGKIFKKNMFPWRFQTLSENFGFLVEDFQQGFQNGFLHDHEKLPKRENFYCKQNDLFCSISGISWKISAFLGFFLTWLSGVHSTFPEDHFDQYLTFEKKLIILNQFRTLSEKNLASCQSSINGVVKTSIYVYKLTFEEIYF